MVQIYDKKRLKLSKKQKRHKNKNAVNITFTAFYCLLLSDINH